MEEIKVLTTLEEVKAISDPYRHRILECFSDIEEPATVKQIADKMGEVPAKVHYHIKKLEKAGIIELKHTKEINGIIAKYYFPVAASYEIKCSKEVEESGKNLILGESQRMISEIYDKSKNTFLKAMAENHKGEGKKETASGVVSTTDLYLKKEEAEELRAIIEKYFKERKKPKSESEDEIKYHCFFTLIKN